MSTCQGPGCTNELTRRQRRFCSWACNYARVLADRREGVPPRDRTPTPPPRHCGGCGKELPGTDPAKYCSPKCRKTAMRWGPDRSDWRGDDPPSYQTAHDRVRTRRGRADAHPCAHCGGQAAEWAYDHEDPDELIGRHLVKGKVIEALVSGDPAHYLPLCRPCHRRFDAKR